MSAFRDEVNATFRKSNPIQIETEIINKAVDIAKAFREDILSHAKDHSANDSNGFFYTGILMFRLYGPFMNGTGYSYSLLGNKRETFFP